ncbi:MAG: helix-turn-helix domain-containing protein [Lachnospiraceae bacterium]|nr:helix-turn-helix domain-containing protein [Lachnospiraceae bacterium]
MVELLTSIEFAKAIGVSHSTVKRWHNKGILKAHLTMPGGARRYLPQQVDEYFERCRERSDPRV